MAAGEAKDVHMPTQQPRRPRVLLGDLEPMTRIGMSQLLAEAGIEVLPEQRRNALVAQARRLMPDAIVLTLEERAGSDLGIEMRNAAPRAKLILWARDETEMRVLDPRSEASRTLRAAPSALIAELATSQPEKGTD
jgi:DNA-binding response OmpR family regulator